ncbi:MAG: hypothetical protein C0592_01165 [Marinilabiliales bacterium]|nr:MAG: hypothetical protein C0592_01165 [Marinilabiliales bacterium]
MRKLLIIITVLSTFHLPLSTVEAQVNGIIVSDTGNITVVKVWGNHYERGFATGYLLADRIQDLYENYIVPEFGSYLPIAKSIVSVNDHLFIDSIYRSEALGMFDGITAAGISMTGVDDLDILVANTFLDLENLSAKFPGVDMRNGCSSLISWATATQSTGLNGNSILTRHLDWSYEMSLIRNQVMVVHFPTDPGEQPWLLIGFAGQMSVLSGLNDNGVGVMQHMMSDVNYSGSLNMGYEPVWLSMRRMLENVDPNQDGNNDVQDVKFAMKVNSSGYADAYIITSVAPAAGMPDSTIALIAEVAPISPYLSFRDATYPDSVIGNNIYAANYAIVRNNAMHFCVRYDSVRYNMGTGTNIDAADHWRIMSDYSSACALNGFGNIQFMQYIPEQRILTIAVHQLNGDQACESDSMVFDLDDLFQMPSVGLDEKIQQELHVYPNPASDYIYCELPEYDVEGVFLYDLKSNQYPIRSFWLTDKGFRLDISYLAPGIYFLEVWGSQVYRTRFIKE